MVFQVKSKDELKPKALKGISDAQIEPHFEKHYKGYIAKLNEGWLKWQSVDTSKANQNLSDVRTLKVEESWNWMGTVLHEYYFDQGPARGKYIDAFFENINWEIVNKRYEKAKKAYIAVK